MAISQRIIENHGGTIEVRSQTGSGSTFTVLLPVEADAYASYAEAKRTTSPAMRKGSPASPPTLAGR